MERSPTPPPPTGPTLGGVAACVLLALAAWSGSLVRSGFSFDDHEVLEGNPVVEGSVPWIEVLRRDYWHHVGDAGHFRPTATASLRIDRALWGDGALGYHLTNVLLHAGCVALLGAALLLAGPYRAGPHRGARALPLAGLALFAAHPVLADSVAWISGRTSMLSVGGALVGLVLLLAWLVPRRPATAARGFRVAGASALGLLLGLLAKEDAIVFAAVYVALAARHSRRMAVASLVGSALAVAGYLVLRWMALGSALPSADFAPLAGEPLAARLAVAGRAFLEAARLAAMPIGYPPSYERAPGWVDAGVLPAALGLLLPAALAAAGLVAVRRRRASPLGWSALFVAACAVPYAQILPAGSVFAPRFLYLPLALAAPLVDALWRAALPSSRLRRGAGAALALALCFGAWDRAGVYADRASFHRAVLDHAPGDAAAWNGLGLAREEAGDLAGAAAAWARAAEADPSYSRPHSNLGRLHLAAGRLDEAGRAFERAVLLGPRNPVAHCNLGSALLRAGEPERAAAAYRRATELSPGLVPAWRGLARSLARSGSVDEARAALARALSLDPSDARSRALRDRLGPGD